MEYTVSSAHKLALNRLSKNITTLGYGNRVCIWVQGCSIGCKGCCSKDTWADAPEKYLDVRTIIDWLHANHFETFDGITISGGEPLEQFDGVFELLSILQTMKNDSQDVLLYTGLPAKRVNTKFKDILNVTDVVIAEPYKQSLEAGFLRGSTNQKMLINTELGRDRYSESFDSGLSFSFDGSLLVSTGIKNNAAKNNFENVASAAGIILKKSVGRRVEQG